MTHLPHDRLPGLRSLMLLLLATSMRVLLMVYGNEFQGGSIGSIGGCHSGRCGTMKRLGLKVEPVSRQRLLWHQTTGQIESPPNQQLEVTTPVRGTVTRLLGATRRPGVRVRQLPS